MSIITSILENVEESQFYLVEHVFDNAIQKFCENANISQVTLIKEYTDLIKEGKMSKSLETKLSKEVTPYLEEYIDIYTPYLFSDIKESDSEFTFADYRDKVGKDYILNMFEDMGIDIGDKLATAASTVWDIKDLEGMKNAINTMLQVPGINPGIIVNGIKSIFQNTDDPNSAVVRIISISNKPPDQIKQIISQFSPESGDMIDKFNDAIQGFMGTPDIDSNNNGGDMDADGDTDGDTDTPGV